MAFVSRRCRSSFELGFENPVAFGRPSCRLDSPAVPSNRPRSWRDSGDGRRARGASTAPARTWLGTSFGKRRFNRRIEDPGTGGRGFRCAGRGRRRCGMARRRGRRDCRRPGCRPRTPASRGSSPSLSAWTKAGCAATHGSPRGSRHGSSRGSCALLVAMGDPSRGRTSKFSRRYDVATQATCDGCGRERPVGSRPIRTTKEVVGERLPGSATAITWRIHAPAMCARVTSGRPPSITALGTAGAARCAPDCNGETVAGLASPACRHRKLFLASR